MIGIEGMGTGKDGGTHTFHEIIHLYYVVIRLFLACFKRYNGPLVSLLSEERRGLAQHNYKVLLL